MGAGQSTGLRYAIEDAKSNSLENASRSRVGLRRPGWLGPGVRLHRRRSAGYDLKAEQKSEEYLFDNLNSCYIFSFAGPDLRPRRKDGGGRDF